MMLKMIKTTPLPLSISNKFMDNCVGALYISYRETITRIK